MFWFRFISNRNIFVKVSLNDNGTYIISLGSYFGMTNLSFEIFVEDLPKIDESKLNCFINIGLVVAVISLSCIFIATAVFLIVLYIKYKQNIVLKENGGKYNLDSSNIIKHLLY